MLDKPLHRRRFLQPAALFSTSLITLITHTRRTSANQPLELGLFNDPFFKSFQRSAL